MASKHLITRQTTVTRLRKTSDLNNVKGKLTE